MNEAELIEFLTNNLTITAVNNPDPYYTFDVFTVSLCLQGNVISQTTLVVNDGIN